MKETKQKLEFEIESSKEILNDEDLELIVLYLENKDKSKCGCDIEDYEKINKYNLRITLKSLDDKLRLLNYFKTKQPSNLSIKDFNLTFVLPLKDLIEKQEDNYKLDNKSIIFYDLKDNSKNDHELLEELVDNLTADTDGCVHESIRFSKLFDSCAYVSYKSEFDKDLVLERFNKNKILNSNCNILFAFHNLNYLVLRVRQHENEFDVIDTLKKKHNFISVRSISKLLLLEFKTFDDLNQFTHENSNHYDIEAVNNLEIVFCKLCSNI